MTRSKFTPLVYLGNVAVVGLGDRQGEDLMSSLSLQGMTLLLCSSQLVPYLLQSPLCLLFVPATKDSICLLLSCVLVSVIAHKPR